MTRKKLIGQILELEAFTGRCGWSNARGLLNRKSRSELVQLHKQYAAIAAERIALSEAVSA